MVKIQGSIRISGVSRMQSRSWVLASLSAALFGLVASGVHGQEAIGSATSVKP